MVYLVLLFTLHITWGFSDEFSASLFSIDFTVDKNSLQVGEEITVTFNATHPSGYQVDLKELKKGLLEYFGYGMTPFYLVEEEPVRSTLTKTEVRYRLTPNIKGEFDLSFGLVKFRKETGKDVLRLSQVIPVNVILGPLDADYLPPPPQFLLIHPLLPVEIDMELKQKLMGQSEDKHWESLFFMRKIPLYGLPVILVLALLFIVAYALILTFVKKATHKTRDVDAILKALLKEMKTIQALQREGKIHPEGALLQMQRALIDCFELRLQMPASSMTVEELRDALLKIPSLEGRSFEDIDSLLTLSLGIKFGKKSVEKEEATDLMDRSIKALEELVG